MNDIYSRTPINKEAALVTSQSGCASDDTLSAEQKLENLITKAKSIEQKIIKSGKRSEERRKLGAEKRVICDQITKLRTMIPKRICGNDLANYVMEILKEEMTKPEYRRLITKAGERREMRLASLIPIPQQ